MRHNSTHNLILDREDLDNLSKNAASLRDWISDFKPNKTPAYNQQMKTPNIVIEDETIRITIWKDLGGQKQIIDD